MILYPDPLGFPDPWGHGVRGRIEPHGEAGYNRWGENGRLEKERVCPLI